MKAWWQRIGPNYQRGLVVLGGAVGLCTLSWIFVPSDNVSVSPSRTKQPSSQNILTDRTPSETGLDTLSADVKALAIQQQLLQKSLKNLQQNLSAAASKKNEVPEAVASKMQQLERQLALVGAPKNPLNSPPELLTAPLNSQQLQNVFRQHLPHAPKLAGGGQTIHPPAEVKIFTHMSQHTEEPAPPEKSQIFTSSLPTGSILTGVLINGLDAPTSQTARREPFPVLVRLQMEAILPNLRRSDIRECFVLTSGYGDLSAERAYLRGETISCICEDGRAIDEPLDAYAVGEDGKAGIRGRVISKQGQAIANSMLAGFLGGAAQAFNVNPIPALNTNPGSKTQYQSILSGELFQDAAAKGSGQALDRVAKFYLDMAENLFPVIEVDAGRQIDIIMKKGSKF